MLYLRGEVDICLGYTKDGLYKKDGMYKRWYRAGDTEKTVKYLTSITRAESDFQNPRFQKQKLVVCKACLPALGAEPGVLSHEPLASQTSLPVCRPLRNSI